MKNYPTKLKEVLKKQGKLPVKNLEERKKASIEALEEMKEVLNKEEKQYLRKILKEQEESDNYVD